MRATRISASTHHPNIVTIYEIGENEEFAFVARAGAESRTLADLLHGPPITAETVLEIALQTASGLAAAHARGLQHGNLHAGKVLMASDLEKGQVAARLTDFELPAEGGVDPRPDLQALGNLCRQLTRRCEAVPAELVPLLDRLAGKDPRSSYASVAEAAQDLKAMASKVRESTARSTPRHDQSGRRGAWILAAGLAVGFIAVAMLSDGEQSQSESFVATPLTSLPGVERDASFSPDGAKVVFAWKKPGKSDFDLYIKSVGADALLQLTESPWDELGPEWSPDGHWIAYAEATSSYPVIKLVDPLGGEERLLAQMRDPEEASNPMLAWRPDSQAIIYPQAVGENPPGLWQVSIGDGRLERITDPPAGSEADRYPEISPSGALAFVRRLGGYRHSIEVMNPDGGDTRRALDTTLGIWGIAWSPDGGEIIYGQPPRIHQAPRLWRVSANGGEARLIEGLGVGSEPAIHAGTRRMVFEQQHREVNIQHFSAGHDASMPGVPVAPSSGREWSPRLSPDNRMLAFISNRSGSDQVWVAQADGSRPRKLTEVEGAAGSPEWSPDGKFLAFDSEVDGKGDIFVIPLGGGAARAIAPHPAHDARPVWSADGSSIYFGSNRGGEFEIWKAPVDGGAPRQMTQGGGYSPYVSSDGRYVYYIKGRLGPELWRFSIDANLHEVVRPHLLNVERARWVIRGETLYFVDGQERPNGRIDWVVRRESLDGRESGVVLDWGPRAPFQVKSLDISNDGREIFVSVLDRDESDLMLVEGFR